MIDIESVEFMIRSSDLRKATKQLSLDRGEFKETDCADLLVSSFAATFRAVGTSPEVSVNGRKPGTATAAEVTGQAHTGSEDLHEARTEMVFPARVCLGREVHNETPRRNAWSFS